MNTGIYIYIYLRKFPFSDLYFMNEGSVTSIAELNAREKGWAVSSRSTGRGATCPVPLFIIFHHLLVKKSSKRRRRKSRRRRSVASLATLNALNTFQAGTLQRKGARCYWIWRRVDIFWPARVLILTAAQLDWLCSVVWAPRSKLSLYCSLRAAAPATTPIIYLTTWLALMAFWTSSSCPPSLPPPSPDFHCYEIYFLTAFCRLGWVARILRAIRQLSSLWYAFPEWIWIGSQFRG